MWLVDKLAAEHADLIDRPYVEAMEMLLVKKRKELCQTMLSEAFQVLGMQEQE